MVQVLRFRERRIHLDRTHTTTDPDSRHIDILRKMPLVKGRLSGTYLYVVAVLEFQSRMVRFMALRVQSAATRIHERLWKDRRSRATRLHVSILAIGVQRPRAPERAAAHARPGPAGGSSQR